MIFSAIDAFNKTLDSGMALVGATESSATNIEQAQSVVSSVATLNAQPVPQLVELIDSSVWTGEATEAATNYLASVDSTVDLTTQGHSQFGVVSSCALTALSVAAVKLLKIGRTVVPLLAALGPSMSNPATAAATISMLAYQAFKVKRVIEKAIAELKRCTEQMAQVQAELPSPVCVPNDGSLMDGSGSRIPGDGVLGGGSGSVPSLNPAGSVDVPGALASSEFAERSESDWSTTVDGIVDAVVSGSSGTGTGGGVMSVEGAISGQDTASGLGTTSGLGAGSGQVGAGSLGIDSPSSASVAGSLMGTGSALSGVGSLVGGSGVMASSGISESSEPAAASSVVGGSEAGGVAEPEVPPVGGQEVTLPDGTTVQAPTPQAASAVRHALTQIGIPYVWGGTTADVGLDCSGFTQWAYGEAGVEIPRLAQHQTTGSTIPFDSVQPGDLLVWDGHVAMAIGNGQLIEAGDPIGISPLRTSNIGMEFYGVYRPSA